MYAVAIGRTSGAPRSRSRDVSPGRANVPAAELLVPDYVVHVPGTPGRVGGIEGKN
jgi:hypothetical protein